MSEQSSESQDGMTGAERVRARADEIMDRVRQRSGDINDGISPSRQEETSSGLLTPEASVVGSDAVEAAAQRAMATRRQERWDTEDVASAAQAEINSPGAQNVRNAHREARERIPVADAVNVQAVIPAQPDGQHDNRSPMELARDRALVSEVDAAHRVALIQERIRNLADGPTVGDEIIEKRHSKLHDKAMGQREWLDGRLGQKSRGNAEASADSS